jgi:hypothetical protein
MARSILNYYGPNAPKTQAKPVSCGGVLPGDEVDVNRYSPPQGPRNIMDPKNPGLHGEKYGNRNGPDRAGRRSGGPGLGGKNRGNSGSQGRY